MLEVQIGINIGTQNELKSIGFYSRVNNNLNLNFNHLTAMRAKKLPRLKDSYEFPFQQSYKSNQII
jgi:hypothetical protein